MVQTLPGFRARRGLPYNIDQIFFNVWNFIEIIKQLFTSKVSK